MKNFIIISILLLNISIGCDKTFAQSPENYKYLKHDISESYKSTYIDSVKIYNSEYDWVFSHMFIFYKKYISSQDASGCSFTPSCSEYAVMAIKKQGFIIGFINFWDRFSRCNGMSPEYYELDSETRLLIDPVRDWQYHEK